MSTSNNNLPSSCITTLHPSHPCPQNNMANCESCTFGLNTKLDCAHNNTLLSHFCKTFPLPHRTFWNFHHPITRAIAGNTHASPLCPRHILSLKTIWSNVHPAPLDLTQNWIVIIITSFSPTFAQHFHCHTEHAGNSTAPAP